MKPICALYGGCCIGGFASFERREAVEALEVVGLGEGILGSG